MLSILTGAWIAYENGLKDLIYAAKDSRPHLANRMRDERGNLLDAGRIGSLGNIRKFYKATFGAEAEALLADSNIQAISTIRHMLIHRAGRQDAEFIREMRIHQPDESYELGAEYQLSKPQLSIYFDQLLESMGKVMPTVAAAIDAPVA